MTRREHALDGGHGRGMLTAAKGTSKSVPAY